MTGTSDATAGRAVLLAGGWMHEPGPATAALGALLRARGYEVEVVTEAAEVVATLEPPVDLLVCAACWFSMTDARYDDRQRAAWAVGADAERESAISRLVDAGVPVLGLHTAVICFDDWARWGAVLGGRWDWSTSSHPPPAELTVVPEAGAPLAVEPFTVVDEEYQGLVVEHGSDILARSEAGHPLVWLVDHDGRRAAVDTLGHDERSLDAPGHRALLGALIDWLAAPAR